MYVPIEIVSSHLAKFLGMYLTCTWYYVPLLSNSTHSIGCNLDMCFTHFHLSASTHSPLLKTHTHTHKLLEF